MAASSERPQLVVLRGGVSVPAEAVSFAIDLEERGFELRREDADTLSVQPWQRLTTEDCATIRRLKPFLLRLVEYSAPEVLQ